jgi:hypothetical protein
VHRGQLRFDRLEHNTSVFTTTFRATFGATFGPIVTSLLSANVARLAPRPFSRRSITRRSITAGPSILSRFAKASPASHPIRKPIQQNRMLGAHQHAGRVRRRLALRQQRLRLFNCLQLLSQRTLLARERIAQLLGRLPLEHRPQHGPISRIVGRLFLAAALAFLAAALAALRSTSTSVHGTRVC